MAEALAVDTLDLPTIVSEINKAVAVAEDAVDIVQKFQNFLPANIEVAVTDLQNILTALQGVLAKA